jgi:hypothetical protein
VQAQEGQCIRTLKKPILSAKISSHRTTELADCCSVPQGLKHLSLLWPPSILFQQLWTNSTISCIQYFHALAPCCSLSVIKIRIHTLPLPLSLLLSCSFCHLCSFVSTACLSGSYTPQVFPTPPPSALSLTSLQACTAYVIAYITVANQVCVSVYSLPMLCSFSCSQ